ncbi:MAG: GTP cyclohydrolase I FolE [Chloroflexota bacterium]|nr:GTP cyclohydrolase I FolE [Chloroflexota bacterium]MBI5702806.1 GTP cyclohydrolase I FolE [Chloroflexota bacterium]
MEFNDDLDDVEITPTNVDVETVKGLVHDLIKALGEDPEREGLKNTPHRVSRMFTELLSGYATDPQQVINGALFNITYDEMVLVRDIEFYSLCEHHMLPFLGRAHVAYLPAGKVIGLSKIPRIVDMYARRLQVQERMTRQIADFLQKTLQPQGVAVVVEAVHLCSMMRGVKKHDARMTTSAMHGAFRANLATRQEFLDNISRGAKPLQF